MKKEIASSSERDSDEVKLRAIDRHGVFLHQRVTQLFVNAIGLPGGHFMVNAVEPEFPVSFGGQGAADLVVRTSFYFPEVGMPTCELSLVVECKRTFPQGADLVLIQPVADRQRRLQRLRLIRQAVIRSDPSEISQITRKTPLAIYGSVELVPSGEHPMKWGGHPVCEDGVWMVRSKSKERDALEWEANKDPLYSASNQLCRAFLGVINSDRQRDFINLLSQKGEFMKFYLPVLVTNSAIRILEYDPTQTDLESGGGAISQGRLQDVDAALYVHPFSPVGESDEWRHRQLLGTNSETSGFKETMLVIRANALEKLLLKSGPEAHLALLLRAAFQNAFLRP